MKHVFTLLLFLLATTFSHAQTFDWVTQLGGTSNDAGSAMVLDNSGNLITTGSFGGTVDFDPSSNTFNLTSAGGNDVFITKTDPDGNLIWAIKIGGTPGESARAIALDPLQNIYITGTFSGTGEFDPGTGTYNMTAAGSIDVFVCKLDPNGNFIWARHMGGYYADRVFDIAVDTSGNVYTTGYFMGTSDYDPGVDTFELSSPYLERSFISKLDSSGNFVWAKQLEGTFYSIGYSIITDQGGNVYAAGLFTDTTDLNLGADTLNFIATASEQIYICKMDTAGNFVWSKQMGGPDSDLCYFITLDDFGHLYATGSFVGTANFDPGISDYSLTGQFNQTDGFICKMDTSGNFIWATQISGPYDDISRSIAADPDGNVYITGTFAGAGDFNSGAGIDSLSSLGDIDIFICKVDSAGSFQWVHQIGSPLADVSNSVCVDAAGGVYTAGTFYDIADFNPGSNVDYRISAGRTDAFIHKLRLPVDGVVELPELTNRIICYPNPTTGNLFLSEKCNVVLTDITGKTIMEKKNSGSLEISNVVPGVYVVLISDQHGILLQTARIIKE